MDELKNGMAEILTFFNIDESELLDMVKKVDLNNDGVIDYQEFITAAFDREQTLSQENLDKTFKTFDSNGDGKIDKGELMAIFGTGQASDNDEKLWNDIIQQADLDGDGEIDHHEFTNSMR